MAVRRLLIVDDDPGFRTVARALLDGETFQVVGEAGTGSAGLIEAVLTRCPRARLPPANDRSG